MYVTYASRKNNIHIQGRRNKKAGQMIHRFSMPVNLKDLDFR